MKPYYRYGVLMLLIIYLIAPPMAWANSGPSFWRGFPSSEVLTVDRECPIEIASEKLSFDFSDDSIHDYTIWGKVTAAYEMVNPTDQDLSVQMAFPFIASLGDFSPDDVVITADGIELPYKLYIGDVVNNYGDPYQAESEEGLAFEKILSTISGQPYQAQHFSENEKGLLYTLEVRPTTEERINFACDFEFDKDKTKVLTNGFNRYEKNGSKVRIASWSYEPETLEILVLGENINFNINAFTDGELKEETDLYSYEISSQEVELKSYIENYVKGYQEKFSGGQSGTLALDEVQFFNLYEAALDRAFTFNEGYFYCEQLMEQNHYQRVLTLVYNVDFPANSPKNVTVNYKTSGTMDKTKTVKPMYSFVYLLNPARNWGGFGNLDIEIITPEEAPHIVESSLDFIKENDRLYRAAFNSLPQEDLSFTIYEKEQISFLDRAVKVALGPFSIFLVPILLGLVVFMVIRVFIRLLEIKD